MKQKQKLNRAFYVNLFTLLLAKDERVQGSGVLYKKPLKKSAARFL